MLIQYGSIHQCGIEILFFFKKILNIWIIPGHYTTWFYFEGTIFFFISFEANKNI